jgi:hypothetical protein
MLSDSDIGVILAELQHIKEDIIEIKKDVKDRCSTCLNSKLLENESKRLWNSTYALWTVVGAFALLIITQYFSGK